MVDAAAVVLAVLCGLAAAYCLARCLLPRWRDDHTIAVDAWHVAMGVAMVAMLLAPVGPRSASLQAAAFGIAALWCGLHLLARNRSGAHLRLGVACAIMAAMLVPAAVAGPASASASATHQITRGHHQHVAGMDMSSAAATGQASVSHAMSMPPVWLAVLMLAGVAFLVVATLRAAAEQGRRTTSRIALSGEGVMALAMGWMAMLVLAG
jgi:hypothetical protein